MTVVPQRSGRVTSSGSTTPRDGNAFIERMFRTLKEEAVWPNEFDTFDQASEAIRDWMIDYNEERPHASLGERTPAEARAEAAQHKTAA